MSYTASISWDAQVGALSYIVEYKLHSGSTWTQPSSPTNPTTATSYQVPGLLPGTAYDFAITAVCGGGNANRVIIPGTTTCPDVTNLTATFSGSSANLSWDRLDGTVSYSIKYKISSTSTYTEATGSPLANPSTGSTATFAITGLSSGTAYDFLVETNCTSSSSTGSVKSVTSTCPQVTGLGVTFA